MDEDAPIDHARFEAGVRQIAEYARMGFRVRANRTDDEHAFHTARGMNAAAASTILEMSGSIVTEPERRDRMFAEYLGRLAMVPPIVSTPPLGPVEQLGQAGAYEIVRLLARRAMTASGYLRREDGDAYLPDWLNGEEEFCALDERFERKSALHS